MKKRRLAAAAALMALILLLPVYREMDDGGSREYAAVLYRIALRHSMIRQEGTEGYLTGLRVDILGITVYDDVSFIASGMD